jgi:hypothetical protein
LEAKEGVKCIWRLILHLRLVRKRRRAHHLEERGFALHEGFEPKTLEGLRGTLGAWSLHGEGIHGGLALPFLFRSFCLERGAHLEEEGRT